MNARPPAGSARDAVLARIRAANSGVAAPAVPRDYRRTPTVSGEPLLELFVDRLVDYKATVRTCAPGDLSSTLVDICREWTIVVPPSSGLTVPGAVADDGLSHTQLDEIDAVLTGCAAACAETGTIALDAGPDQGRRAITLIPDRHVCVVRADQVVHTVPELLARLDPARPLTFISGPSATSDIELHRVEGVHGPRTLIVVLVA
ncbi:MAG: LUD domain-containing protein [Hamadaea sp.]|uniref:LutC/YkgG family protein n=1 Tax=Hamadaea sp. TaxID=2024425 RepID=UPI001794D942|nr:LUD domain-containing protein [Hamadaea sp.]NUR73881.1 LUD domain-containing protein [Hamadaea sp.]NUT20625.1 LUD domain-containing protein [Hamadaea sp.]